MKATSVLVTPEIDPALGCHRWPKYPLEVPDSTDWGVSVHFVKRFSRSPAVLSLIAVLTIVFVAQVLNPRIADILALPGDVANLAASPWSPLTVLFLHEVVMHLVIMIVMLAGFGVLLEQHARSRDVLAVYLLAGLAGSLGVLGTLAVADPDSGGTLVGASAAVFGVAGAVLAMRPSERILGGKTSQWITALVAINIVFLLSQPLGSVAHLLGLGAGVLYGRRLRRRALEPRPDPVPALDDSSSG